MIHERFKIKKEIGNGSFSVVHKAKDIQKICCVAVKFVEKSLSYMYQAECEALTSVSGLPHFPKLIWRGEHQEKSVIVMQLLGKSLTDQIKRHTFSVFEICDIGVQLTNALQNLHESSYLHRDIKTDNIVSGKKTDNSYYFIDFGLSKPYIDKNTKHHYPERQDAAFKGNLVFCSNNILCGIQASRRDDIISLQLVLIFLIKRRLPWIKNTETAEAMIGGRCSSSTSEVIKDVPEEIGECFKYASSMTYYQKPDYSWMISLLERCRNKSCEKTEIIQIKKRKGHRRMKSSIIERRKQVYSENLCVPDMSTQKIDAPDFSMEFRKKIKELKNKLQTIIY